jgi:hypothetical protein
MQLNEKAREWVVVSSLDAGRENYRQAQALEKELQTEGWERTQADTTSKLSYKKEFRFREESDGWKLSKTEHVDILDAVVTVQPESEFVLDAPKGLVIDTYPPVKQSETLAKDDDSFRLHIPLQYAVNETPYLNMTTSTQTIWGTLGRGIKWLFSEGLKWLAGILLAAAAAILTAKLTGLFGKKDKLGDV